MINENKLNYIKEKYPVGSRVKLNYMEDPYAVPSETLGTIEYIDDEGQIEVSWDNGRTLSLIYGVDSFDVIDINKDVDKQINI